VSVKLCGRSRLSCAEYSGAKHVDAITFGDMKRFSGMLQDTLDACCTRHSARTLLASALASQGAFGAVVPGVCGGSRAALDSSGTEAEEELEDVSLVTEDGELSSLSELERSSLLDLENLLATSSSELSCGVLPR